MEKLDKILHQALAKRRLSGTARAAQICFIAEEWGKGRFSPISFLKGVLKVSVTSSAEASELEIIKEELIDYINTKLGNSMVKMVRIQVRW